MAQGPRPLIDATSPPDAPDQPNQIKARQQVINEGPLRRSEISKSAPQASGGPDDFGYTWVDTTPYSWIDATTGTNTGIIGDNTADMINIGFPFKFYGRVWTQASVSTNGFMSFSGLYSGCCGGFAIPAPIPPNNVIAPYWADLAVSAGFNSGAIYTFNGGAAPNRYFVVEWKNVTACCQANAIDYKTFELILFENGNIKFQYQLMNGDLTQASVGVEDSTGLVGLQVLRQQPGLANGKVYQIAYPPLSAHVTLNPSALGAFGSPGTTAQLSIAVRNIGELGTDTFDLFSSSGWPMTLYEPDGITPLTDTDGDSVIDTGPIVSGWIKTIVVKIVVPVGATSGQANIAQVIARSSLSVGVSKTARLSVAVPAMFMQNYSDGDNQYADFYRPTGQIPHPTSTTAGVSPVAVTTPDGNIVQVWDAGRVNTNGQVVLELYYALLDSFGNTIRSERRITDLSAATNEAEDIDPAVAIAPNGSIGIIWYRYLRNAVGQSNYNIYVMILNSSGAVVLPPTNLTNNSSWGSSDTPNVPRFYSPSIAATPNNRFVLAWHRQLYGTPYRQYTTYYAVRDSNGAQIKAPTTFGTGTSSHWPILTSLADGSVFLSHERYGEIAYGRFDGNGNILTGPTEFTANGGNWLSDAAQLPNGNIVLVWEHWNGARYVLQYAVLNSSLGIVKGVTNLPSLSRVGDEYPSVTRAGNRAVITWGDACCDYQPNLYYALLDSAGNLLTSPMIFASDNYYYAMVLPSNGQGITYLPGAGDSTPPTNPTHLSSNDHTADVWSNDNTVNVAWSGAADSGGSGLDGYSVLWDTSPSSVPDKIKEVEETVSNLTSPILTDGSWYFHIRATDNAGNAASGAAHLGPFKIDTIVPQSTATSPAIAIGPFTARWSGTDSDSGINHYRIEVQDGPGGGWTAWLNNAIATSATYTTGVPGHTYSFRSVAVDAAGNVEADAPADGDTHTLVAAYQVTGHVFNNRHQSIFNADVSADPAALIAAKTDGAGSYTLYFASTGTYNVTAGRGGFGALPPQINQFFNGDTPMSEFVLPPMNDAITNGGFETGDLTGWSVDPLITATVEMAAAHTGSAGLRLTTPVTIAATAPAITQTISISGTQPTVSFMYRVTQGSGDPFIITIAGEADTITHSGVLTPTDWTHTWIDLTPFSGQTITLTFGFQNPATTQAIDLDEINVGDTTRGVYSIFLPIVRR
jgi:hypothetical protein